jgi:hypothetical protein
VAEQGKGSGDKDDDHSGDHDAVSITVVVSGKPVTVRISDDAKLGAIIPIALKDSGNVGQPPENWELRDGAGQLLDLGREISDYGFKNGTTLFLNLKAGVGG